MNQQLLQKVPRFQQLPDQLLRILIHSLNSRINLPNELAHRVQAPPPPLRVGRVDR